MEVSELRRLCTLGEYVMLKLPPPCTGGRTRRLAGRRSPGGVVIIGSPEYGQLCQFESEAVLEFLDKEGE